MNTNPFPSQSTTGLDAKGQSRSRVKVAVYSVVAVHVAGLVALLLTQGCKEKPMEEAPLAEQPAITNEPSITDSNLTSVPPFTSPTNYVEPQPPVYQAPVAPVATTYEVKAGESFTTIAAANQTTVAAITAANPGVDSRKLKIGQKLNLPAPGAATVNTSVPRIADPNVYVVKSGDVLGSIAKSHGTTVSAIKALNGLATDKINVGQKLKMPVKAPATTEIPPVVTETIPALAPGTAPVR
jgi:LysM repeat protein